MRVLLTINAEQPDNGMLRFAINLCRGEQVQVFVVHVAPFPEKMIHSAAGTEHSDVLTGVREALDHIHTCMDGLIIQLEDSGIKAEKVITGGELVQAILTKSEELKADMIIAARRHHGKLATALGGNTSLELARRSTIPVLLYPG